MNIVDLGVEWVSLTMTQLHTLFDPSKKIFTAHWVLPGEKSSVPSDWIVWSVTTRWPSQLYKTTQQKKVISNVETFFPHAINSLWKKGNINKRQAINVLELVSVKTLRVYNKYCRFEDWESVRLLWCQWRSLF